MTDEPSAQDRLVDALHDHFMLDALGPIGCECPKASDEEHVAAFVLAHLAAQEPDTAGPHELDESAPIRNLGYYRSSARCKCGDEIIWGEHDGDAGLDEAWRVHLMRSDVHVARAARREEK